MIDGYKWNETPAELRTFGTTVFFFGLFEKNSNGKWDKVNDTELSYCGATRVGKNTFLTAAHCFFPPFLMDKQKQGMQIFPAVFDEGVPLPVTNFSLHPSYPKRDLTSCSESRNDVALFYVEPEHLKVLEKRNGTQFSVEQIHPIKFKEANVLEQQEVVLKGVGFNEESRVHATFNPNERFDSRTGFSKVSQTHSSMLTFQGVGLHVVSHRGYKNMLIRHGDSGSGVLSFPDFKAIGVASCGSNGSETNQGNLNHSDFWWTSPNLSVPENRSFLESAVRCGLSRCSDAILE